MPNIAAESLMSVKSALISQKYFPLNVWGRILRLFAILNVLQIQRSDDRTSLNVDLTYRFLLGFENVNCSFESEKSLSIAGSGSFFLSIISV